ncbi:OB-fold nucleic acid binding domain-containing protein [Segeticoccus rhizosphaerae]|uniref:OB-fold nucleic acid binding domain-containing protein n=1 Tax=Segeticoccus rhizosphaerae TaxID=1104777 RepID=UPI0013904530|nr:MULTISPECIES: OB-fold nucleic acid binding domain-containing protein [Intrasporangiaceae]
MSHSTASTPSTAGRLRQLASRLSRTQDEAEVEELRVESDRPGVTAIAQLQNRRHANVCGVVRSVTLRPRENVPALAVELYDGTELMTLVWLGRRRIRGIEPGVFLTARGCVCMRRGTPTMFNPYYELMPGRGH